MSLDPMCPYCLSTDIVKFNKYIWYCNGCERYFANPYTAEAKQPFEEEEPTTPPSE